MLRSGRSGAVRLAACGALIALATGAFAEDVKEDPEGAPTAPAIASNCDLTEYKWEMQTLSPSAIILDNVPAGATYGPIVVPSDGMFIEDVVLELDCSHTWLGDLIVRLDYDENTDGLVDVSSTVICRPGRTGSCGPTGGTGIGCGSNFATGSIYRFDDTATGTLPTSGCLTGTNIPGGCYRPTGVGAGPLSVFEGLTKGGRWWLFVSDNQSGDSGTLTSWSVHLKNTPVSTTHTSWGRLKSIYR